MIFNASERKGSFMLIIIIVSLFVLPRHFRASEPDFFLIPIEDSSATKDTSLHPLKPQRVSTQSFISQKTSTQPVELNHADSATLVKIRGIGPYYAAKIVRYREQLGGFYSVNQLKELKMKHFHIDSNAHLFTVNSSLIRVVDLDTSSFKSLVRHPYLVYEEVQLIFKAKQKYGHINCDTLEKYGVLTLFKLKKIKPYFK